MKELLRGQARLFCLLLLLGLALRLFYVCSFPHVGGDSPIYESFAINLLHYHTYSHLDAQPGKPPPPTLIRTPGYPLFLASVFAVAGDFNETAVRVVQAIIDTAACFFIALIAFRLASGTVEQRRRAARWSLILAVLCPFIGNYSASILAEVPTIFFLTVALWFSVKALQGDSKLRDWLWCGFMTGVATLFRPESGLWLLIPGILALWRAARGSSTSLPIQQRIRSVIVIGMVIGFGLALPLIPWTVRNALSLKTFQPLAPTNAENPGEFVPYGYMNWCKTWLWRFREVDGFLWPMENAPLSVNNLPPLAFDSRSEKDEITTLFNLYNADTNLTPELDGRFEALARRRGKLHPLRTWLELPFLRSLALWLTPRREILPLEGKLWPLGTAYENDPRDFALTLFLFLLNIIYIALAVRGCWTLRNQTGWLFLLLGSVLLRTLFLAYFTFPEPRYVLEVYPMVIVLAGVGYLCDKEP